MHFGRCADCLATCYQHNCLFESSHVFSDHQPFLVVFPVQRENQLERGRTVAVSILGLSVDKFWWNLTEGLAFLLSYLINLFLIKLMLKMKKIGVATTIQTTLTPKVGPIVPEINPRAKLTTCVNGRACAAT